MAKLLATFGKGILYVLVLPIVLVVLAIFAVVGVFQFIIVGIKAIILFFSGRNIFGEFPEDIKARKILNGDYYKENNPPQPEVVEVVTNVNPDPYVTSPFDEGPTPISPVIDTVPDQIENEIKPEPIDYNPPFLSSTLPEIDTTNEVPQQEENTAARSEDFNVPFIGSSEDKGGNN